MQFKKYALKGLLLLLAFCLAFSSLSACSGKKSAKKTKKSTKKNNSTTAEVEDTSSDSSFITDDVIDDEDIGDIGWEDPEPPAEDDEQEPPQTISVQNAQTPLITNFRGLSGTVYECYTYMDDLNGRNYTEKMATRELDRLQKSGFHYIRSIYKVSNAWNSTKQQWDFASKNMNAIYRWAQELQKRKLEICINAGWTLSEFATGAAAWIGEPAYIRGYGNDLYGETAAAGLKTDGLDAEQTRLYRSAARYAYWMQESLTAFKQHGINNITYINCFTEPKDEHTQQYMLMLRQLNNALKRKGMRHQYKIIGPNSAELWNGTTTWELLDTVLKEMTTTGEKLVDVVSAHQYNKAPEEFSMNFVDTAEEYFTIYSDYRQKYNYTGEFWLDEYNCVLTDHNMGEDQPWMGTQLAATFCRAMDHGISNTFIWSFANQLWPNSTSSGGEFLNGVQLSGLMPCILDEIEPFSQYYSTAMLARAFGYEGGSVYRVTDNWFSGLSAGCSKLKDGNWVVLVVNNSFDEINIELDFEKAIGKNMYRHLYNPGTIQRTSSDKQIPADTGFRNVKTKLVDSIPVGSVAIYTTVAYR